MRTRAFSPEFRAICATTVLVAVMAVDSPAFGARVCEDAPMVPWAGKIEQLYPGKIARVEVTVRDERPYTALLAEGLLGKSKKVEKGKGLYYAYMSQIPDEVAIFMADSAREAVAVLGLDEGPLVSLEIVISQLQIDLYRVSSGPMYCVAYMNLGVALKDEAGAVLEQNQRRLVFWEYSVPVWKFNEVAEEALSRIHQQAAWQVTVETLLRRFPQDARPDAVAKLLTTMGSEDEDMVKREMVFWLGLVGRGNPAVNEELTRLFRTSKNERIAEAASEALGLLGVSSFREEVDAVLSGSKRLDNWDLDDFEPNWYLLKTLHLLGETNLETRIPKHEMKLKWTLSHLATFLSDGTLPARSTKMVEGLEEAKEELQDSIAKKAKKER